MVDPSDFRGELTPDKFMQLAVKYEKKRSEEEQQKYLDNLLDQVNELGQGPPYAQSLEQQDQDKKKDEMKAKRQCKQNQNIDNDPSLVKRMKMKKK